MFIIRRTRTFIFYQNAVSKRDLPLPKKYQLHKRLFATDKNQVGKMVDPKREVSYEDLLNIIDEHKKTIIDVRNPDEVNTTGMIPSSINIPLDNIKNSLQLSENDFRKLYNCEKPSINDEIVFYCKSGKRATEATQQAMNMGYQKSKTYIGSWSEWSTKQK